MNDATRENPPEGWRWDEHLKASLSMPTIAGHKINSITVIRTTGTDKVLLKTDLLVPIWPYNEKLSFGFESARELTKKFLEDNFPGIPVEYIPYGEDMETAPKPIKFSQNNP